MVTSWFITIGLSLVAWVGTLFQPFVLPSWLSDPTSGLYAFLNTGAGIGSWLPMQALANVAAFALVVFSAVLLGKFVLFLWSRIPFLGGGG